MQTTPFENIQCKSLSIVDNDDIERVRISADQNGGRIDVVNKGENGCGFTLSFLNGQPVIGILNEEGKLGVNLFADAEGGVLNILGKDGKTKITLFVEQGRGKILSGEDTFNLI